MALKIQARPFKYLIAAAGILGLILRFMLYATGVDEKGLLGAGHWASSGVFLLTSMVTVMLFLWCRSFTDAERYSDACPSSPWSAAGSIAAGIAFLLSGTIEAPSEAFAIVEPLLRLAAAASLIWVGFCRFTGRKPLFLFHCCVCLYLGLRLVCQYRIWSVDPQIQNYCFFLGAHIALMLTCYQLAAFDAGFGSQQQLWAAGLAAVYLAIVALVNSEDSFLLLCCTIWIWTSLNHSTPGRNPNSNAGPATKADT